MNPAIAGSDAGLAVAELAPTAMAAAEAAKYFAPAAEALRAEVASPRVELELPAALAQASPELAPEQEAQARLAFRLGAPRVPAFSDPRAVSALVVEG